MPARKANELTDLIKKLRTIRRQHEVALEEIEKTFKSFGIEHLLDGPGKKATKGKLGPKPKGKPGPKPGKKRGRKPGRPAAAPVKKGKPGPKPKAGRKGKPGPKPGRKARRTRGSYAQTGDEFIVSFVSKKGGATTSEIRQAWDKAGRKGKPENNITGLVKSGKLVRTPIPGKLGSTYTAPGGSTPPATAA